MKRKKSKRGVVLNGDAVVRARTIKNNWTQEGLAAALRMNVEQIRKAENEQPIDPPFAHAIAKILGVPLEDLEKKDPVDSTNTPPKHEDSQPVNAPETSIADALGKLYAAIMFTGSYKPPFRDIALKRLNELALFLGMKDGYNEDGVEAISGSLIVTVPLSRRDTALLMSAFVTGELEQFGVVSINVATNLAADVAETRAGTSISDDDVLAILNEPRETREAKPAISESSSRSPGSSGSDILKRKKICPECAHEASASFVYCPRCGSRLKASVKSWKS
jgi:transcriptional regulator with XRE-family HTH domain